MAASQEVPLAPSGRGAAEDGARRGGSCGAVAVVVGARWLWPKGGKVAALSLVKRSGAKRVLDQPTNTKHTLLHQSPPKGL